MFVPVTCGSCGTALEIDREHVGWRVRCPKCSQIFLSRVGPGTPVPEGGGGGGGSPSPYAQTYTPPQGWSGNPSPPPVFSVAAPAAAIHGPEVSSPATQPFVAPPPLVLPPTTPLPPHPGSIYEVFAPPISAPAGAPMLSQARTAFIFGILALAFLHILTGIPAVIMGYRARRRIRESGGQFAGDHLALAGIIMGAIGILLTFSDFNSSFSLVRLFKNPIDITWDNNKPPSDKNGRNDRR